MPLRYGKTLRRIFKDIVELRRRGALDETLYRNFLRENGKALRELQRAEDKREQLILERLKAAVQLGLDDSEAGLYRPVPELASPDFMAGGREFHKEREIRILLFEHGTDAYKKLVQGAKIISPLF